MSAPWKQHVHHQVTRIRARWMVDLASLEARVLELLTAHSTLEPLSAAPHLLLAQRLTLHGFSSLQTRALCSAHFHRIIIARAQQTFGGLEFMVLLTPHYQERVERAPSASHARSVRSPDGAPCGELPSFFASVRSIGPTLHVTVQLLLEPDAHKDAPRPPEALQGLVRVFAELAALQGRAGVLEPRAEALEGICLASGLNLALPSEDVEVFSAALLEHLDVYLDWMQRTSSPRDGNARNYKPPAAAPRGSSRLAEMLPLGPLRSRLFGPTWELEYQQLVLGPSFAGQTAA